MSVLGLIDQEMISTPPGGIEAPSTTFTDVVGSTFDSVSRNYGFGAKDFYEGIETTNRDQAYKAATGRDLYDDVLASLPEQEAAQIQGLMAQPGTQDKKLKSAVDGYLDRVKQQDPDRYKDVYNSVGVDDLVKKKAKDAMAAQAQATAGATGMASFGGQLVGGLGAGFTDPLNLATIPIGAGLAAGIFKTALVEAGVNAGSEVLAYPFVKKWQDELGQEYGPSEFAENIGMAALFGGVIGGGAKGIQVGLEKMSLPNSAKLAVVRERFNELENIEASQALRHEERRLHIQEADVSRYSEDISPETHPRALNEVDSAINEDRPIDAGKLDLSDEQIRSLDPKKMDQGSVDVLKRIKEKSPEAPTDRSVSNELLVERKADVPSVERQQELLDLHESPEARAQEKMDFETAFPEERAGFTFTDDNGNKMSIADLRESFKDDSDYVAAITSCGIGGR